jgi:hypothetical protein
VWLSSSEVPACNLERWMKNFNGRPFFSLFFVARANQKIRILALGRERTIQDDLSLMWDRLFACLLVSFRVSFAAVTVSTFLLSFSSSI